MAENKRVWQCMAGDVVREHWPTVLAAAMGLAVALGYLITTLDRAGAMGYPIDDAYIYLTYARQFGRAQPFTYYDGGDYSAGATSVLWPVLIAPLWTVGLRGYVLVVAVYVVCAGLLAAICAMACQLGRRTLGLAGGFLAAVLIAASPAFTWGALCGMEVGLAAFLVFATALRLLGEADPARPSAWLLVLLAATAISRPEFTVLIAALIAVNIAFRGCCRDWRGALRWSIPLAVPLVWVAANRLLAGNFFPNTGVAKSHFYLPGFDWTYYIDTVAHLSGQMLSGLLWADKSPLWQPQLLLVLWLIGAFRLLTWARRERQWSAAALLVAAPPALLCAVIAASGAWHFHNYRYISVCFPALFLVAGLAVCPPRSNWLSRPGGARFIRLVPVLPVIVAALVVVQSLAPLQREFVYFAQGVRDSNAQVVTIGRWIAENLPRDAHVAFHDAGAIAYYGDRRVTDILGLVSNGNAHHANHGPGARFEMLERLSPDQRPSHFAYYPGWLGTFDLYGKELLDTPLPRALDDTRRLVGGANMRVFESRWDRVGSGHVPLEAHPGWVMVDRLDVADLVSERAHDYRADMGRRRYGHPTARWTLYYRPPGSPAGMADGGRTIRGKGGERFRIHIDPARPLRLIMRTGGKSTRWATIARPGASVQIRRADTGAELGVLTMPGPSERFHDLVLEVRAGAFDAAEVELSVSLRGAGPYRTFHYFALQPETP